MCRTAREAQETMFYATQARDNAPHYQHTHIGYNYRMSNICAGIGRGQMTIVQDQIVARRVNRKLYGELFAGMEGITLHTNPSAEFDSNYWLTCIVVDPAVTGFTREDVHLQPVFKDVPYYGDGVAAGLFDKGLCLPSGPVVTHDDIIRVVDAIESLKK